MKKIGIVGFVVMSFIALALGNRSFAENQNLDSHGYGSSAGTAGTFVFRDSTQGAFQFKTIATSSSSTAGIFGSTTTHKFGGVVYDAGSIFQMNDSVGNYVGLAVSTGGATADNLVWLSSQTARGATISGQEATGNKN